MNGEYEDIIHLPHHTSKRHPRMSLHDRAAQFSPFAALTGFETAIEETGRLTDTRFELEEYGKKLLNQKLTQLMEQVQQHPHVSIVYFQPDDRKSGGSYIAASGRIRKIDLYRQMISMMDGKDIPLGDIVNLESDSLFPEETDP